MPPRASPCHYSEGYLNGGGNQWRLTRRNAAGAGKKWTKAVHAGYVGRSQSGPEPNPKTCHNTAAEPQGKEGAGNLPSNQLDRCWDCEPILCSERRLRQYPARIAKRGALLLPVVPTCSSSTCWHQAVKQQQPTLKKTQMNREKPASSLSHTQKCTHACRSVKHTYNTAGDSRRQHSQTVGWQVCGGGQQASNLVHNLTWVSSAAASTTAPCNNHQRPPKIMPSAARLL